MPTGISGLYKNTKGAKASPKTHNIKILPQYFDAIENGTKTFEIRYNDRDYKVGDLLCLREYRDGAYTGRETVREICYMIDDSQLCKEGYVVLGLKQIDTPTQANSQIPAWSRLRKRRKYAAGYRKQSEGEWAIGKSGCMYFCSSCNYAAHPREEEEWNFCPHCGAKMKGGE